MSWVFVKQAVLMSIVNVSIINCKRRISEYRNSINYIPRNSLNPCTSKIVNVQYRLTLWNTNESYILQILTEQLSHYIVLNLIYSHLWLADKDHIICLENYISCTNLRTQALDFFCGYTGAITYVVKLACSSQLCANDERFPAYWISQNLAW